MTFRTPIFICAASVLTLASCADPGAVNGNGDYQNTRTGALVGAAGGAVLGEIFGGNAVKGAVIGAAVGGITGSVLDKQEAELRNSIDTEGVTVTNTGDRLIVTMPNDVTFATDSYVVRSELKSDLADVAASLKRYPDSVIQVLGHTDNTGDAAYNMRLSERRAEAVADVLMNNGVPFSRIQTIGRGEDQPIASNLNEAGRAQNRRVELVILPNG
ncbi:OmpA family protein [Shimia biformata]|uniref:OmpA family protein n=1 Tax=Shimia biformata TaxID=1294299 RepID=UPI00195111C3|nr:OmpA family protein [Shimia biformata]